MLDERAVIICSRPHSSICTKLPLVYCVYESDRQAPFTDIQAYIHNDASMPLNERNVLLVNDADCKAQTSKPPTRLIALNGAWIGPISIQRRSTTHALTDMSLYRRFSPCTDRFRAKPRTTVISRFGRNIVSAAEAGR